LFTRAAWEAAWDEVRRAAPLEAVGAFVGRFGRVERIVPLPNVHPAPEVAYRADPKALLALLRALEASGEELLAFYHSHPGGLARPSETDRQEAYWNVPYVIFGLAEGRARAFLLPGGEAVPIRVES
jgi:proteasome lid subunit RPN8/RPN11